MEGQRILIVSSDGSQSGFMVDWLRDAGYETWVADLGEHAIDAIQKEIPNLVILDWGFLNYNGLQIIQAIRAQEKAAHLPILVMGTEMREEDVLASLDAGAEGACQIWGAEKWVK